MPVPIESVYCYHGRIKYYLDGVELLSVREEGNRGYENLRLMEHC